MLFCACYPLTWRQERAWYKIATAVGATAGNRRGIDVTSMNEGANIARSIVMIITAENWPIVVYACIKHHFSTFPYAKFATIL